MRLSALPALEDNYVWVLGEGTQAIVIDPGEAAPVLRLAGQGLRPQAILLTHHHGDHWGGVPDLLERWPGLPVYAPEDARIALDCRRVGDGERIRLPGVELDVIGVPGHTLSHIAYTGAGHLFCGDTLFSLGCGRMFEGSPAQMHGSLQRLAALPAQTRVCGGHEYTLSNAAFALAVEPGNLALQQRQAQARLQRGAGRPTLPTTLASELDCNPFLRCEQPAVRAAVSQRLGHAPDSAVEVFAALRQWKDGFRP